MHFTVRDKPAVLDQKIDVAYLGNIRTDAESCVVSFPGKYASAWEALTKEKHSRSVACVFLSTPEDGLGRHSNNPISGKCYCHEIYGERDYKTFGYLKVLGTTCAAAQEQLERDKAKSTNTVVVRADASEQTRKAAEQEAQQAWERSGKTASWGCAWFEEWKNKVAQAVKRKQRLKVVFFVGQVDDGKVAYDKLPESDLWNGMGIGGSQKGEVAYLDLMREQHGEDWAYDSVDVAHFLTEEFHVGAPVYALDGEQWCRGTLLAVPEEIPKEPKDAQWIVQLRSGKVFSTNRLRHADEIEQILAKIGENHFMEVVRRMLPAEVEVADGQRFLFQDGRLSYAIRLGIKNIEALQQVRNLVLSNDLETLLNHALEKKETWRLQIDKTAFCKNFESELLRFSKLTEHQLQRLQDINKFLERGPVHLSAPAGAGKTFVAVQCALTRLAMRTDGNILFVAPSIDLGLFFARWITQRNPDGLLAVTRLVLMEYPYDQFLRLQIKGHLLKTTPMPADTEPFLLTIIDESHDVLQLNHDLLDKIKTQQLLLLSSQSQASGSVTFPKAHDVELKQIVRSTKRIVAGAAAFQSQAAEKKGITSLCPAGPPIKTFLFEDRAPETLERYGEKTAAAVLYVMHSYAGLSLHGRLALLVPDHNFLQKFTPVIRAHLRLRCPGRCFQLTSFQESLSILPNLELKPTIGEKIVLDTVEHAKGLEQLIVVCVGLDEPVGKLSTCAKIYQAITRAQLQAIVVNRLLRGGWLQFLGLMTFKEETFDEVAAMAETTTDAAAQAISVPGPVPGPASRTKAPRDEGSDPSAEPKTSSLLVPDAGISNRQSLLPRTTSVWDTEDNIIKEPIQHLQFDPRSLATWTFQRCNAFCFLFASHTFAAKQCGFHSISISFYHVSPKCW